MENDLVIWAKSDDVFHVNYHYTQFGEVINYLNRTMKNNNILGIDLDIQEEDVLEFIKKYDIKKIAIAVNYENARNAFELVKRIKEETSIPTMAYGPLTIMLKDLFLNSSFDAIHNSGDYECSIRSFITSFKPSTDINDLEGLSLIRDNHFEDTKKGSYIDSKQWGISSDTEVPIEKYDEIKGKNRYVLNFSRGCPFGCEHCLIQLTEGNIERRRDLENAKLAIDIISQKYKHIKIWAANFTLNKKYVYEFCQMMKNNFDGITWECATRIDLVKDTEMLRTMYEAGCRQISLGIESLNNLELIGTKNFQLCEIDNAINNIQAQGMVVKGCIMLGMPNQSKGSIINTLEYLKRKGVIIRPTIYTPYHLLNGDISLDALSQYNRKTYKNTNVQGIEYSQLLELVSNPYDYVDILKLNKNQEIER